MKRAMAILDWVGDAAYVFQKFSSSMIRLGS